MKKLTIAIITKNCSDTLEKTIKSIISLRGNIIAIDDLSNDGTVELLKKYNIKIFSRHFQTLGAQRKFALSVVETPWVFFIDSDEVVTNQLAKEITATIQNKKAKSVYYLSYQNHFLGKKLNFGGENYQVVRLFKKNSVKIISIALHEKFLPNTKSIGYLKSKMLHYSYRSIPQIFIKFTKYAIKDSQYRKSHGERASAKKLTLYPLHMFWSRFVSDKGYKDGMQRIILDIAFAYLEFLTYLLIAL